MHEDAQNAETAEECGSQWNEDESMRTRKAAEKT